MIFSRVFGFESRFEEGWGYRRAWKSVLFGWNESKFFQGFFDGGLVVIEEALGTTEALDAGNCLGDGAKGFKVNIGRNMGIVIDGANGAIDEDVEEGKFVMKFTLYIGLEGSGFFFCEQRGVKTMNKTVHVTGLTATFTFGGNRLLPVGLNRLMSCSIRLITGRQGLMSLT